MSMKNGPLVLFFIVLCGFAGVVFFLVQRKWVMIEWTYNTQSYDDFVTQQDRVLKKEVQFFWRNHEKMHHETVALVWRHDKNDENIKQVVHMWLDYIKTDQRIDSGIGVDSVVLTSFEESAYISFNKVFSWAQWSIFEKYMLIECLCKTIKSTGLPIKNIVLLVQHEHMADPHLDFSHPWPIECFLSC